MMLLMTVLLVPMKISKSFGYLFFFRLLYIRNPLIHHPLNDFGKKKTVYAAALMWWKSADIIWHCLNSEDYTLESDDDDGDGDDDPIKLLLSQFMAQPAAF